MAFKDGRRSLIFATTRNQKTGQRFGVQIFGTEGVICLETGWLPAAALLKDRTWKGYPSGSTWVEISSAGLGRPETRAGEGFAEANLAIVDDLIKAVEMDGQPRASLDSGRTAIEMILACYASQVRGGSVSLPLLERDAHPLSAL
jgi:predicted dehydrogenase